MLTGICLRTQLSAVHPVDNLQRVQWARRYTHATAVAQCGIDIQLSLPVDAGGPHRAGSDTGLADHAVPGKAGFAVQLQITDAGCGAFTAKPLVIHGAGIGTGGAEGASRSREIEPGNAGQGMFGRMQPDYVRFAGRHTGMRTARAAGFQWQPAMPWRGRAKRLPAICLLRPAVARQQRASQESPAIRVCQHDANTHRHRPFFRIVVTGPVIDVQRNVLPTSGEAFDRGT